MLNIFPRKIEIKELRQKIAEVQNTVDVLIGEACERSSTRGNPYRNYLTAIKAVADKYEGTAQWGVQQIRNIVDLRSAFIIGQGIKIEPKKKGSREQEFIEGFIKHNDLDEEMPQDLAKEAEIEGRMLVKLIPNTEKKQIDLRYISYSINNYKVVTATDDYKKYEKVTWRDMTLQKDMVLLPNEFVYKKFAGRVNKVNDVMPKVAMVLRMCEALDKALNDWRDINHLFAAPTPHFKCTTDKEVEATQKAIKDINWRIGKLLITTAEYALKGPESDAGLKSLENEIITLAKVISGATGIPVHFLGLPDLMSNRAVSTDLFEFINASTNKERHVWEGLYEEIFDKAIRMANESFKTGLVEDQVNVNVLQITEAKIKELVDIWMPLYAGGIVDLDYVLSKIPDADPDKIKTSLEESAIKQLDNIKAAEKANQDAGVTQ